MSFNKSLIITLCSVFYTSLFSLAMESPQCKSCHAQEFLPLQCKGCSEVFCDKHFKQEDHSCSAPALVQDVKAEGPVGEKDANMAHIFGAVERRHDELFSGTEGNSKVHVNVMSSEGAKKLNQESDITAIKALSKLENVAANGSRKQQALANKTKDLLLKGKAMGSSSIDVEDRVYLVATFSEAENERKCIFFNAKTATVGDMCEYVAKSLSMPSFKKVMRPKGAALYLEHVTEEGELVSNTHDRRKNVADVFSSMQAVTFCPTTVEEAASRQTEVAILEDQMSIEREERARVEAEQKVAEKVEAARLKEDSRETLVATAVQVGDSFIYSKEGANIPASVKAIHKDDYPNLYFSVVLRPLKGDTYSGALEKQTTTRYMLPVPTAALSAEDGGFSVNLAHGARTHRILGVGQMMTVLQLKAMVQQVTSVAPKNQKLICKGKVLMDSDLIRETGKVTAGCKIALMAKK